MIYQGDIITPLSRNELKPIMNKINLGSLSDVYIEKIVRGFNQNILSIDEKNQLLIAIISEQIEYEKQYLNGFNIHNACTSCNGKGFNIHKQLVWTTECPGTHDCLPCNGSGIMTKVCLRCDGHTLNAILEHRQLIISQKKGYRTPGMNKNDKLKFQNEFGHYITINIKKIYQKFIEENGDKTFRVIKTERTEGNKKYSYIQKNPCRACGGTGRFEYTNTDRTIKCPGCHGKGGVKKHLKSTNKIKSINICKRCGGSGQNFGSPVLNLREITPETKKILEERGLLKKIN